MLAEIIIAIVIVCLILLVYRDLKPTNKKSSNNSFFVKNYNLEQTNEKKRIEDQKKKQLELDRKNLDDKRRKEEENQRFFEQQLRRKLLEEQVKQQKKQDEDVRRQIEHVASQQNRAQTNNFKPNWKDFERVLHKHNISKLYHFTDRDNLPSIKRFGGLFSWHYCQQQNIRIPRPGGSATSWDLDKRKGLQNYVRTSFVKDHPMMFVAKQDGRIKNPIILEIKVDVIYFRNSQYTNQNAARNGVLSGDSFEHFSSIRFPLFQRPYFDLSMDERHYYQAEVLVLEKIPSENIININYV